MNLRFRIFRFFKRPAVWAGLVLVSSANAANAAVVPSHPGASDKWLDMRRELESAQSEETLSAPVRRVLVRLDSLSEDYREIMALSYSVALSADMTGLDAFWTNFISGKGDAVGYNDMLSIRARVLGQKSNDRQSYLGDWLYLAVTTVPY